MGYDFLTDLGITEENSGVTDGVEVRANPGGRVIASENPATGEVIARVRQGGAEDYEWAMARSAEAFRSWRMMPAPKRGEIVRLLCERLREYKEPLGKLVTLEMGKILSEGQGEVQEMIDVGDFAVGLSRQLYGLSMHSERPCHRMYEQWHPLGVVGVITSFNFPVAVWAWNSLIAAACGDTMVWKPSSSTPLCAIATQNVIRPVLEKHGLGGVFALIVGGGSEVGERMIHDRRLPLISFTGSTGMGRKVGEAVARRLGRSLLELGGNNGIVVMDDADLELCLRAVLFGAVGTAGQRCTTTRRLIMQKGIAGSLTDRLVKAYRSVGQRLGDPLDAATLVGPLVNGGARNTFVAAVETIKSEGGEILVGGNAVDRPGYFVEPTLVKATKQMAICRDETFAPILYLYEVDDLDEAVALHNDVDQGLSSAIFTTNLLAAESFLSHAGSDCGIANVNIGTSGAEIGGAFGGEKETGGGRESGSDSWKAYMRRQTCTLNWSKELPLAQGVTFDI